MSLPKSAQDALVAMYEAQTGNRLKEMEKENDMAVRPTEPYIIRIDGVAFHTFTKGVQLPFDSRITRAMVETTKDLVSRFGPVTGYTQSDEISLVFPAVEVSDDSPYLALLQSETAKKKSSKRQRVRAINQTAAPSETNVSDGVADKLGHQVSNRVHAYNGRIQKLASVTASYASARFNYHLTTPATQWDTLATPQVRQRMIGHGAYFDSRVVILPDLMYSSESIFWRSNFDGMRNAISHISQAHFSKSELHGKTIRDQSEMLAGIGVDVMAVYGAKPLFGTWVKKEQYMLPNAVNMKTGEPVVGPVQRTRLRAGSFNWADWSEEERLRFTILKYWPNDAKAPPMDPLEPTDTE
ncbi:hypothetical protein BASA50_006741 [Batrachochytrium salamandrivorans]|uniref:tRNA(His) guanylyltransferase n=1 Tax=Batrachochytrium salamandrivorans TaxID=1357716 RepID=A0ABQ8F919_9FUNG|nr:hypothetical protein BASA50_006741 [Batrachochytrium salamandrivorans]